jgi:sRNA-binding carbon storage regulator CsrA
VHREEIYQRIRADQTSLQQGKPRMKNAGIHC